MHGRGIYKWRDGSRYEGEWKLDKMSGKGLMKYADGRTSTMEYKGGVRLNKRSLDLT